MYRALRGAVLGGCLLLQAGGASACSNKEPGPFKRVFKTSVENSPNRGYIWVFHRSGERFPDGRYDAGFDTQFQAGLSVCRAKHEGGLHPGKIFGGRCNISWGGKEFVVDEFETLIARQDAFWHVPAKEGMDLTRALVGGHEDGKPLPICVAHHVTGWAIFKQDHGRHPGKFVAGKCHIGWGGKEYPAPDFFVLALGTPLAPTPPATTDSPCPKGEAICECNALRGCSKAGYCSCLAQASKGGQTGR
jgi:hypothetical protein